MLHAMLARFRSAYLLIFFCSERLHMVKVYMYAQLVRRSSPIDIVAHPQAMNQSWLSMYVKKKTTRKKHYGIWQVNTREDRQSYVADADIWTGAAVRRCRLVRTFALPAGMGNRVQRSAASADSQGRAVPWRARARPRPRPGTRECACLACAARGDTAGSDWHCRRGRRGRGARARSSSSSAGVGRVPRHGTGRTRPFGRGITRCRGGPVESSRYRTVRDNSCM